MSSLEWGCQVKKSVHFYFFLIDSLMHVHEYYCLYVFWYKSQPIGNQPLDIPGRSHEWGDAYRLLKSSIDSSEDSSIPSCYSTLSGIKN
jgi:hypothetical protein